MVQWLSASSMRDAEAKHAMHHWCLPLPDAACMHGSKGQARNLHRGQHHSSCWRPHSIAARPVWPAASSPSGRPLLWCWGPPELVGEGEQCSKQRLEGGEQQLEEQQADDIVARRQRQLPAALPPQQPGDDGHRQQLQQVLASQGLEPVGRQGSGSELCTLAVMTAQAGVSMLP